MPQKSNRPAVLRGTWRPEDKGKSKPRWKKRLAIFSVFLLLAAGVWLFFDLLIQPIRHPNTFLLLAKSDYSETWSTAPIHFADDDLQHLLSIEPALAKQSQQTFAEPIQLVANDEIPRIRNRLNKLDIRSKDVLIFFISSHGIVVNQEASLVSQGYDPSAKGVGTFSIKSLLKTVSQSPAKTKLLILDSGQQPIDSRLGVIAKQFPSLLRDAVVSFGESNIWVLASNDNGQRALVSENDRRSVFAYFVQQGLMGHADANQNKVISVQELFDYVRDHVTQYTSLYTDGPTQTPILLGSSGSLNSSTLLSVPENPGTEIEKAEETTDSPEFTSDSKSQPMEKDEPVPSAAGAATVAANDSNSLIGESEGRDAASSIQLVSHSADDISVDGAGIKKSLVWKPRLSAPLLKELESSWNQAYSNHSDLVEAVWGEYFSLTDSLDYPRRPIDFAPTAWRDIGKTISKYDYQIRRGIEVERSADRLNEVVRALRSIKNSTPIPEDARFDAAEAIERAVREPIIRSTSVSSFSCWNELQRQGFAIPDPQLKKSISEFEAALNSEDSKAIRKWISESPDMMGWYEPWLAQKILANKEFDWQQQKEAIYLTLVSGSISSPIVAETPLLKNRFRKANQLRQKSIRLVLDRTSSDWNLLAKKLLAESRRSYETAHFETKWLTESIGLRNKMLFRLPYYLKLPYANNESLINDFYVELNELLDATLALDNLLKKTDELSSLSPVIMASENVFATHADFLDLLLPSFNGPAETSSTPTKSAIDLQSALIQPVFAPTFRSYAISVLKKESAKNPLASYRKLTDSFPSNNFTYGNANELIGYQRQVQVELKLAALSAIDDSEYSPIAQLNSVVADSIPDDLMIATNDLQRVQIEKTEATFANFYFELPKRINAAFEKMEGTSLIASHRAKLARMRELKFSSIAVDAPQSSVDEESISQSKRINLATCFEVLNAQYELLNSELKFFPETDKNSFRKGLEFQRLTINELRGQPKVRKSSAAEIEMLAPKSVSLTSQPQVQIDINVRYSGSESAPVWLVFDYDRDSISAKAMQGNPATDQYRLNLDSGEPEIELNLAGNIAMIKKLTDLGIPPAFIAKPGDEKKFSFLISTLENASDSNLILKAISASEYVRHETKVRLPAKSDWTLFFDSPYSETNQNSSVIELSPLPNQTIDYGISILNNSGRSRNIRFGILAPELTVATIPPDGELNPRELGEYLEQVGRVRTLFQNAKFTVDASNSNQRLPMQTAKPPAAGETADTDVESAANDEVPIKEVVRNGFLFVVTDIDTLESRVWLVQFRPQMPRRFLNVVAGYDKVSERIEFQVTANDGHQIPYGGHRIKCSFANSNYRATESQLNGLITEENRNARLFAYVPRAIDRVETVYLEIDDYPRAFVFRIPCWDDNDRILEAKNEMRFQLDSPEKGKSYLAPVRSIPIEFQIDAPVGAFKDTNDFLEIGIDADRDRELNKESAVRIHSDRQANVFLVDVGKSNGVTIENKVSDFKFNLPGNGYRNSKVNLLGKIQVGSRMTWSNPVEIILDAAPPIIERTLQNPERSVSPDEEVEFRIMVEDSGLSGVASVQIGFADEFGAKFSEKSPPIAAEKQQDENWLAKLPLAESPLGLRTVLINATDQVGNISKFKKLKINVVSKAEREAAKTKMLYSARGLVVYFGKPQTDVDVFVLDDGEIVRKTKTLADGSFEIKDLPAGKFKLKAKSVIRNKPRIDTQDLNLGEMESEAIIRLDLK